MYMSYTWYENHQFGCACIMCMYHVWNGWLLMGPLQRYVCKVVHLQSPLESSIPIGSNTTCKEFVRELVTGVNPCSQNNVCVHRIVDGCHGCSVLYVIYGMPCMGYPVLKHNTMVIWQYNMEAMIKAMIAVCQCWECWDAWAVMSLCSMFSMW